MLFLSHLKSSSHKTLIITVFLNTFSPEICLNLHYCWYSWKKRKGMSAIFLKFYSFFPDCIKYKHKFTECHHYLNFVQALLQSKWLIWMPNYFKKSRLLQFFVQITKYIDKSELRTIKKNYAIFIFSFSLFFKYLSLSNFNLSKNLS